MISFGQVASAMRDDAGRRIGFHAARRQQDVNLGGWIAPHAQTLQRGKPGKRRHATVTTCEDGHPPTLPSRDRPVVGDEDAAVGPLPAAGVEPMSQCGAGHERERLRVGDHVVLSAE